MPRLRAILVWCVVLWGGALAHHPVDPAALVGLDVCVDDGSFAVNVVPGMPPGVVDARDSELGMRSSWTGALSAAGVPWHDAAACTAASAYLEVGATVRFLDPATYVGFPEESVSYVYHARVAPHPGVGEGVATTAYAAGASEVLGGSDVPGRVASRLHDVDRRSAMGFAQAWWTAAQPPIDGTRAPSVPWLIASAVMISTVWPWFVVLRSRRNRRRRRSLWKPEPRGDQSAPPPAQEVLHVARIQ